MFKYDSHLKKIFLLQRSKSKNKICCIDTNTEQNNFDAPSHCRLRKSRSQYHTQNNFSPKISLSDKPNINR